MSTEKPEPAELMFAEGAEGSFGDVSFPVEAFEQKSTRVRISIMMPADVLEKLRTVAARKGKKYQTLTIELLREALDINGELGERLKIIQGQEKLSRQVVEIQNTLDGVLATIAARTKSPTKKIAAKKR